MEDKIWQERKYNIKETEFMKMLGLGEWELESIHADVGCMFLDGTHNNPKKRIVKFEVRRIVPEG